MGSLVARASEDYEVRFWSKRFKVVPDLLRAAVEATLPTPSRKS
jgi:hypothetical protein